MATQSPNLGLTLPIGSENVSRQIINDNNLIIDGAVESKSEELAIVINCDTAPKAITSGQYLFIKNHTTLPTGGYHATANIANGAAVTSSNVAQDADGIANALNGNTFQILYNGTHVTSFKIGNLYGLTFHNYTNASATLGNGGKLSDYNLPNPTGTPISKRFMNSNGVLGECLLHFHNNEWQISFYSSDLASYIAPTNMNVTLLYSVDG